MTHMTTTVIASTATSALRDVVDLARLAPSVHNTQPWWWRIEGNALELHADNERRLTATDPTGRNLLISCGTALHHGVVAAEALGWSPEVHRLPEGPPPGPLAVLRVRRGAASTTAERDLRLVRERCTDRRRFTSWPVPADRLRRLTKAARGHGVQATILDDVAERFRTGLLLARAHAIQSHDPAVRAELAAWLDRPAADGVPAAVLPPRSSSGTVQTRFPDGALDDSDPDFDAGDALVVLSTIDDDASAWLRTGEALSALWLRAVDEGLSVVPLSQPIEVGETRDALRHDVLGTLALPQLLVRIGWQAISRSDLPRTPRRPVDAILRP